MTQPVLPFEVTVSDEKSKASNEMIKITKE